MTRLRHPSSVASITLTVSTLALACAPSESSTARAQRDAPYDRPISIPAGVPYEGVEEVPKPEPVASAEECGRGRGIDGAGDCVALGLRDLEIGGMVQIPAGAFLRGDIPVRLDARSGRARPHHEHSGQPLFEDRLPSYWIDGYEISRRAYAKCVAEGGCSPAACLDGSDGRPPERPDLSTDELAAFPQTCVTYDQAAKYCEWRGARLPSEAEWEFAARGPEGWIYPWGYEFRDELGVALGPVGYDPLDVSYFGLKGFGGNAIEWVADAYEPDANLSHYLAGPFRDPEGPLARSFAEWTTKLCGGSPCELGTRRVVKGGRAGARSGAWQLAEGRTLAELPESNFEGDRAVVQNLRLGFRCASDLGPDDAPLTSPKGPAALPLVREQGGYQLFMPIAEAVNRAEAERFCAQLVAPGDPAPTGEGPADNGWRLPTLDEVRAVYMWFGGPGPFWLAEGAGEQTHVDTETAEWAAVEASDDEALMARCIRSR